MSSSSRSDSDDSVFDVKELLEIEARCRELRKEKDLLKETQSQSFDLIKRLELHVRRLNEARLDDKRQNQELQRELNNCHQEIDFLQDQINERTAYADSLEEQVYSLNAKLSDIDLLEEEIVSLREELKKSKSECDFLRQDLEIKETELQQSCLHIENLEESISSAALEYQCEIESMRLEMMTPEQKGLKSKEFGDECSQEKTSSIESLLELQHKLDDAHTIIRHLEHESKQDKDRLEACEKKAKLFCQRVEEHFRGRLEGSGSVKSRIFSKDVNKRKGFATTTSEASSCGAILGPLLSKLLAITTSDADGKGIIDTTPHRLLEYEQLVKQLKDELKEQKSRAKEEAEDLAQEMAELRYQLTELLEEERKRRACIEQASLQRISALEAELQMERRNSVANSRGIRQA